MRRSRVEVGTACLIALAMLALSGPAHGATAPLEQCWTWTRTGALGGFLDLAFGGARWLAPGYPCTTDDTDVDASTDAAPQPTPVPTPHTATTVTAFAQLPVPPRRMAIPDTRRFTIRFEAGSATLDAAARDVVEQVVVAMRAMGPVHITAVGYPDPPGKHTRRSIALERANAVRMALVHAGLSSFSITASAAPPNAVPDISGWRVALAVGD